MRPEGKVALDEIDTSVTLLGKTLRVPLIVAAMTGGTARAREINRELASAISCLAVCAAVRASTCS